MGMPCMIYEEPKDTKAYLFYKNWVEKIEDSKLKVILEHCLRDNCYRVEDFNIERATSSTHKYHPKYQNGENGNGLHTKAVLKTLEVLTKANPKLDKDCLYVAAILHDSTKYKTADSEHTDKSHHITAAKFFETKALQCFPELFQDNSVTGYSVQMLLRLEDKVKELKKKIEKIRDLIFWHAGYFTPEHTYQVFDEDIMAIHYADMIASSRDFAALENFEPNK